MIPPWRTGYFGSKQVIPMRGQKRGIFTAIDLIWLDELLDAYPSLLFIAVDLSAIR